MKRIVAILLFVLLVMPVIGHAEEPFLFRGRYAWGMSADEVKALAAEEGLILQSDDPNFLSYQNVPVAGIIAEELNFRIFKNELKLAYYIITLDTQRALAWYPGILEKLTLLYGDYDEAASQQCRLENECASAFVWKLPAASIVFIVGQAGNNACVLSYLFENAPPPPPPTPDPVTFTTDGL